MANGQQPVDDKTMRQMVGKRMMFGGLGQVFGSHASAPQAAAIQAGYNRMGEVAAENMRNRFYKQEWDQVRETRIKPELDKLSRAQARWKMVMTPANTDYVRTAGRDEAAGMTDESMSETKVQAQQSQNQMGQQDNPGEGPAQVRTGGTTQGQNDQTQTQRQRSGNPAMAIAGQVGVQIHSQEMTIPDPRTGQRVLINSPEGMALYQEASSDFWGINSEVQQELMSIGSEYSLNPFAQRFMQTIMQNAMNQAGHGATGRLDPLQAQGQMDKMAAARSEREASQLATETGRFELESARAQRGDEAAFARRRQGFGAQPGGIGDYAGRGTLPIGGIGDYAGRGTLPAGATDAEAAAFGGAYETNLRKMRSEAGAEGTVWIAESHLEPGNEHLIIGDLRNKDPLFQADLEQALFQYTSGIYNEMSLDPGAWLKDNPGVSTKVRDLILTGGISDPEVTQYIEQMVQATPAYKQSVADISYQRLKDISNESPDRVKPALLRYARSKVEEINPEVHDTEDYHDLQRRLESDPMWVAAMNMNNGIAPSGSTPTYRKADARAKARGLSGRPSRTPLASYEPEGRNQPVRRVARSQPNNLQISSTEISAAASSVPDGPVKRYKAPKTRRQRSAERRRREYGEHGLGPRAERAAAQAAEDVKDTVKGAIIELKEGGYIGSPENPIEGPHRTKSDSLDFLSMIQKRRQSRAQRAKDTVGSGTLVSKGPLSSKSNGTIGEN